MGKKKRLRKEIRALKKAIRKSGYPLGLPGGKASTTKRAGKTRAIGGDQDDSPPPPPPKDR